MNTVNGPAQEVDSVLASAIAAALPIAKAAEVAAVPWLGWPVISPIFDALQAWVIDNIRKSISLGATFLIIDFQVEGERRAFLEAAIALRGQLSSPEANAAFDKTVDKLIQYDGWATPK